MVMVVARLGGKLCVMVETYDERGDDGAVADDGLDDVVREEVVGV